MKKIIFVLFFGIASHAEYGVINRIVDGDTVHFNHSTTICRLAYIDTPESKNNDKAKRDASECIGITPSYIVEAGIQSSSFLNSIMTIGDTYAYNIVDTDHYGRSVCEITKNGLNINLQIIESGYGVVFNKYINDASIKKIFNSKQVEAKSKNRGLWGTNKSVMKCMEINKK